MEEPPIPSRDGVERQVLAIAAELVNELGDTVTTPRLESSLERDLGISSLERVELLLRLEQAFHVRLPDAVMAEADTLADVVTAVLRAEPRVAETLPSRREPQGPGTAAPSSAATLVDVLYWHAERTPDRVHIHLRENHEETPIRYGELLTASQRVGAGLRARGMKRGDTPSRSCSGPRPHSFQPSLERSWSEQCLCRFTHHSDRIRML
jgi:acyl carrier protein